MRRKVSKLFNKTCGKNSRRFRRVCSRFWNKIWKRFSKILRKFFLTLNLIFLINLSVLPPNAVQAIGLPYVFSPPAIIRNVRPADGLEKIKVMAAQVIEPRPDKIVSSSQQIDKLYQIAVNWNDNSMTIEQLVVELRGGDMDLKTVFKFAREFASDFKELASDFKELAPELVGLTSELIELADSALKPHGMTSEKLTKLVLEELSGKDLDKLFRTLKIIIIMAQAAGVKGFSPLQLPQFPRIGELEKTAFGLGVLFEQKENSGFEDKKNSGFENFEGPKPSKREANINNMAKLDLDMPELNATMKAKQMQAKYKHAHQFGVEGNYNPANLKKYMNNMREHMNNKATQVIRGTYRGIIPVIHYFNPETNNNVIVCEDNGIVISGWQRGDKQVTDLENNKNVS